MDHEAVPLPSQQETLCGALLESRQRWRDFGALAADLMFETDEDGRLTFLAPEAALGWPPAALLGTQGAALLSTSAGLDPFRCSVPLRRQRAWLRTASGTPACMAITTMPMVDRDGRPCGSRGIAVDVTEEEAAAAAAAAAIRRGEVLDHVLVRMRQEVLAPRMMPAILGSLAAAIGAEGAAVLSLAADGSFETQHRFAGAMPDISPIVPGLTGPGNDLREAVNCAGVPMLAVPCSTRFGAVAALVVWRGPQGRCWDGDDRALAGSVAGLVRIVLEHEAIERELARQARTDPLTGLLNRRAFVSETDRRLDRLETDGLPGTLLFIDLDKLKLINDVQGHDVGDAVLTELTALLTRTFRPSDLIARLGGDEFAIWLDGADSLTAAERADHLCRVVPEEFAHLATSGGPTLGVSIGIATREPGSGEQLDQLMVRADQVMYAVKRAGGGNWRVAQSVHA